MINGGLWIALANLIIETQR